MQNCNWLSEKPTKTRTCELPKQKKKRGKILFFFKTTKNQIEKIWKKKKKKKRKKKRKVEQGPDDMDERCHCHCLASRRCHRRQKMQITNTSNIKRSRDTVCHVWYRHDPLSKGSKQWKPNRKIRQSVVPLRTSLFIACLSIAIHSIHMNYSSFFFNLNISYFFLLYFDSFNY